MVDRREVEPSMELVKTKRENISWTTSEVRILRDNARLGAVAVAALLGRSISSVEMAAYRHRISLRRTGCRRGSVLGQPRGFSLAAAMRTALVDNPRLADLTARRMTIDRAAELCPHCCLRPIEVVTTGLCAPCHLRSLAEAHREAIEIVRAQRELWASRQELKRARRALQEVAP
jgi:hypothetical protein